MSPAAAHPAIRGHDGAVQVLVRAQPGAKKSAIVGMYGDRLKVAVQAPPVDGKANAALCSWLADLLDLPQRCVTVGAGQTSRDKRLDVQASVAHVVAKLHAATPTSG